MTNSISNLFLGNGLILDHKNYNSNQLISEIKINYKKFGIILINNFSLDNEVLTYFTDKFTLRYANDANRRKERFGKKNIRSVDIGNHEIPLHSESSFTPTCPEIMWFYCLSKNLDSGTPTTICDGIKVWENLPLEYKKKFLAEPVVYEVEAEIKKKNNSSREWFIESIGVQDPIINFREGKISYKYKNYAVNNIKILNKISFCNHILSLFDEKQILNAYFQSDKNFLKENYKYIKSLTDKFTYEFHWKKNQLLMIDNKRFMHGRRAIKKDEKRDIVNIQTLISNF